ncbi:MAG: HAMP domain-containing sensor histidine kinase [Clostridia bacterium]|nr:HAMP domain-containing sensor histidine kinase [Clostridia bacterium]
MKRLSIKLRVTIWFTLIMLLAASLIFYIMISHRQSQIKTEAEQNLIQSVNSFSQAMKRPLESGSHPEEPPQEPRPKGNRTPDGMERLPNGTPKMYGGGVHIAVYNENQELIQGQIPFELEALDFEDGVLRTVTSEGELYLIYDKQAALADDRIVWIKGVSNLSGSLAAGNLTATTDYLLILLLIAAAAAGGYLIVKRALSPVERMSNTAREIAKSNDLSRRIGLGAGRDEIYTLATVLDEMLDQIQFSFEAEQQFTADASHELRTPAAVILSECEFALDYAKTPEEFEEAITVIKRQGDKMNRLIGDLLTLSRMDQSRLHMEFAEIDFSDLLEVICEEQREIQSKTLICDIEQGLLVKADSSLLARLLINLITNAFSYGNTTVWISLHRQDKEVVFQVRDDGAGIPEEQLPKIWERFYQVDRSRSQQNGSMGLGLAMVKQIAQLLEGRLEVQSILGQGSIFTYRMQLADYNEESPLPDSNSSKPSI